jgi:hypothetical protein
MPIQAKALEARAILLPALALLPSAGSAQVSADSGKFGAQLYLCLPELEGTTNIPGSGSTPGVSVDVAQILDNFESGSWGRSRRKGAAGERSATSCT